MSGIWLIKQLLVAKSGIHFLILKNGFKQTRNTKMDMFSIKIFLDGIIILLIRVVLFQSH